METITVPMNWQMLLDRGYDKPQYTNVLYPYPFDPPHVPQDNPCALYVRHFMLPELPEKEWFLHFEGVDSCFYLWVNGHFAAYSQVSHALSEINVTDYLNAGENEIRVLVLKWCDGSYLEDQDCWRLSGIFRDVYLLAREHIHLRDLAIRQQVHADLKHAQVTVHCETLSLIHI